MNASQNIPSAKGGSEPSWVISAGPRTGQ
jgi:hypothetical protein